MNSLIFVVLLVGAVSAADYSYVIDAGSSGLKLGLFHKTSAACPTAPSGFDKVCGGLKTDRLTQFHTDATSRGNLATFFSSYMTSVVRSTNYEIYAYATAGNRIISSANNNAAWGSLKTSLLGASLPIGQDTLFSLHGTNEAALEFIAANFLDNSKTLASEMGSKPFASWKPTVSLGGASAQIAIPLNTPERIAYTLPYLESIKHLQISSCNIESSSHNFIQIGNFDSNAPFYFENVDPAGASRTCTESDMSQCPCKVGKLAGTSSCVLLISFLSNSNLTPGSVGECNKVNPATIAAAMGKGACIHSLVGGLDETESLYKAWRGIAAGTACTGDDAEPFEQFVDKDCQFARVKSLLTGTFTYKSASVQPFSGLSYLAVGTVFVYNEKHLLEQAGSAPGWFRCIKPYMRAFTRRLGITTIEQPARKLDWADGIARKLQMSRCDMPAKTSWTGLDAKCENLKFTSALATTLLEELSNEIEGLL